MTNSDKAPLKLEFNWKISLFSLLLLPILVGLGFWQLQRADEKNTIQQMLQEQQARPPATVRSGDVLQTQDWLYRPVQVIGEPLQDRVWLLENQIHQGRIGFHLLVPVQLSDGAVLLVNCGWLPANADRKQLPVVPPLPPLATLHGQLTKPSHNPLLQAQPESASWPKVILQIDLAKVAEALAKPVVPWVLQLNNDSAMALVVDWRPLNMSAAKHHAYAVQWFLMAVALVILSIYANSNLGRRKRKTNSSE